MPQCLKGTAQIAAIICSKAQWTDVLRVRNLFEFQPQQGTAWNAGSISLKLPGSLTWVSSRQTTMPSTESVGGASDLRLCRWPASGNFPAPAP